jgi:hypothetical protein
VVTVTISEAAVAAVVAMVLLSGLSLLTVAAAAGYISRTPGPYGSTGGDRR